MPDKRILPDWLDAYMELSENSEPPTLFRKWTGISAIASALQRKVRVEFGMSLTFYPNFYIVLVGPSATGKGTAMQYALDILEQVPNIRLSAQATSLQALIRRMKETNLTDIDPLTGEQQFHSSLTIFSTEFTVFLGYQNNELIAALCEWYDCHSRWSYETISRQKEEIIGVWVNLIGGTTPDSIQSSLPLESIGGGLTSRIIFVYEEKRGKLVIFPSKTQHEIDLQHKLVTDLEQINMLNGRMQYTDGFMKTYADWCYYADKNPPFYDKKFDGYCGRRRKHLISLSMVCSASRSNEMVITKDDLLRAIFLIEEVEVKMGLVFKGIGKSDISSLINDTIVFVENSLSDEIPYWQFARHFEGNMDKFTMERVLVTLEAANYVKVVKRPGSDTLIKILDRPKNKRSNSQPQLPSTPEDES